MKRLILISLCLVGAGQLFAEELPVLDPVSIEYQNRPHIDEIYATSQEKPQSLSGAPFKAGDSETFGIKDTSKKGLPVAAHLSPHLNPPPQGGRKEGGEEGDFVAAVFTPLLL